MVVCLERGADLHMVQLMPQPLSVFCFTKIQIGFTFMVPADLGSPGKRAIKQGCVCVEYVVYIKSLVLSFNRKTHPMLMSLTRGAIVLYILCCLRQIAKLLNWAPAVCRVCYPAHARSRCIHLKISSIDFTL